MKYSKFFALVIAATATPMGRHSFQTEVVAIDEDAARADIMEAFAGVSEVQLVYGGLVH